MNAKRIAVCIADFPNLGDHLALLPLYHGLRLRFPEARILLASRYGSAALALEHGFVDELIEYRRADFALWRHLRRFAPDISICLRRRSLRARLVFGRPCGAPITIGLDGPGSALLHEYRVPYLADVYRPYRYLEALAPLQASAGLADTVRALARSSAWSPPAGRYAVLVPAGMLAEKQWGVERFAAAGVAAAGVAAAGVAAAADELKRCAGALEWFAVIGEREIGQGFAAALEAALPGIRLLCNAPLPQLARLFLGAALVIANDCGPGNLAQMAGAPVVIIFGNWDGGVEERMGWWLDRRPGVIGITSQTAAPIGSIGVASVVAAARELLADPSVAAVRRV